MSISFKEMAQLLENMNASIETTNALIQQMAAAPAASGNWISPFYRTIIISPEQLKEAGVVDPVEDLLPDEIAVTEIDVLNFSNDPADIFLDFFNVFGGRVKELATILPGVTGLTVGSLRMDKVIPIQQAGWMQIHCDKPVFPSGYVTELALTGPAIKGGQKSGVTVRYPMFFYPVSQVEVFNDS